MDSASAPRRGFGDLRLHERGADVVVGLDDGRARQAEVHRAGVGGRERLLDRPLERFRVDHRHPAGDAAARRFRDERRVEAPSGTEVGADVERHGPVAAAERVDQRADGAVRVGLTPAAVVVRLAVGDGERRARVDGVGEARTLARGVAGVGEALDSPCHAAGADRALEGRVAVLDDQAVELRAPGAAQHLLRGLHVITIVAPAERFHKANVRRAARDLQAARVSR
jgi:hypothetical protein